MALVLLLMQEHEEDKMKQM